MLVLTPSLFLSFGVALSGKTLVMFEELAAMLLPPSTAFFFFFSKVAAPSPALSSHQLFQRFLSD